ncbi:MAG TPA: YceH family protein [Solirubrobacteraceae bacterium]
MNLSASETRVLGCLLEKQRTTPDQYPLSLNALRLACNQSTNRDPVVEYDEAILRDALHRLERRGYTRYASGAGSRTPKYRHLLAEALPMAEDEQAVMCVLMLRGPQTPGELKQRADRMHQFAELGAVHETLERLIARELVACLGRRPGQKEDRYAQLLQDSEDGGGESQPQAAWAAPAAAVSSVLAGDYAPFVQAAPVGESATSEQPAFAAPSPAPVTPALEQLEQRVARLERELAELRAALGEPVGSER